MKINERKTRKIREFKKTGSSLILSGFLKILLYGHRQRGKEREREREREKVSYGLKLSE